MNYNALKYILVCITTLFAIDFIAQDTTRVETFTFDDISKRRGWFEFPSEDVEYRKIMMHYTLKCDQATQQDNFSCGEWDYTTYTDLYQYEGVGTPYFRLGGQNLDSIEYVSEPIYDYQQYEQQLANYIPVIGQGNYDWGVSEMSSSETLRPDMGHHRAQYIYTAAELAMPAGPVDIMALDLTAASTEDIQWLTVRLGHTSLNDLSSGLPLSEGLQEVYSYHTSFGVGLQEIPFNVPFDYDGTSNLVLDITMHTNSPQVGALELQATQQGTEMGIISVEEDRHLDFFGDRYVEVPSGVFETVDEEITISFWIYGDEEVIPFNTYAFEGVDSLNRRVVNAHLPWSNSRVYWDAGNAGSSSYDRIDIEVAQEDLAGRWSHWAFTKNATTGDMAIYLDGELFHSGTGHTRSMAGIDRFKIGGRASQEFTGNYDGHIDEFRVWDTALSQEEIADYLHRHVDAAHPQYASFRVGYDFNEATGAIALDHSPNGMDATLMGLPVRQLRQATAIDMAMELTDVRPDLRLYQNSGTPTFSTQIVTELIGHPMVNVIETIPYIDQDVTGMSYTYVDTSFVYLAGESVTYGVDGEVLSSEIIPSTGVFYNSFKAVRHQLQNYVTPYGIGLSLGPDGFRWEYEVTDYALLFDGIVEIAAGNQQELIDLEFEFIEGTPPREVLDFETIWLGDYQHRDIADDLVLPAVDRTMRSDASEFMMRTRTTGHWFGGFNNCAEFCPKNFNLAIDGIEQFEWLNWKECADNPVIDQGGTWIYDRAGWCPGTFADSYDHEITPFVSPGATHSIDFGMQPYVGTEDGNYRTTLQFFQYGAKNFEYDVEVSSIISPNIWEFQNRYNPICKDAVVEIRNLGSAEVTSVDISYWVEGGNPSIYTWTGSLNYGERTEVMLPIASQDFWNGSGAALFSVSVANPNGIADEHADNDVMQAEFEWPEIVSEPFFVWFKSNSAANECSYELLNDQGEVIFARDDFEASTIYRDTLYLDEGCYSFRVEDTGQDGLSFFANSDGNGYFRLRYVSGSPLQYFNSNFGSFINYQFVVDNSVGITEHLDESLIRVSPNPGDGLFVLNVDGYEGSVVQVDVLDAKGSVVYSDLDKSSRDNTRREIDLRNKSEGIYFARILIDGRQVVRKLIKE